MEFLRLLESVRFPAMDSIMSAITHGGDEMAFMAVGLLVFWCISKRIGYYLFFVDYCGTVIAQSLKLLFRVPRPWVIDPAFTIVESARAGASDYSFPSGHTVSAVSTFGCLAMSTKRRWLRAACGVLLVLVPFSRMYLGVHTPLDVGAAFAIAALLVIACRPLFASDAAFAPKAAGILLTMAVFAGFYLAFIWFWPFPEEIDAANLASGEKSAYTIAGAVLGLAVSFFYDRKYLRFETSAPLLGQILKLTLGLAILFGIRSGLKALFSAAGFVSPVQNTVRYFLMVIFAGCVWPHTFSFFAQVGEKKTDQNADR